MINQSVDSHKGFRLIYSFIFFHYSSKIPRSGSSFINVKDLLISWFRTTSEDSFCYWLIRWSIFIFLKMKSINERFKKKPITSSETQKSCVICPTNSLQHRYQTYVVAILKCLTSIQYLENINFQYQKKQLFRRVQQKIHTFDLLTSRMNWSS